MMSSKRLFCCLFFWWVHQRRVGNTKKLFCCNFASNSICPTLKWFKEKIFFSLPLGVEPDDDDSTKKWDKGRNSWLECVHAWMNADEPCKDSDFLFRTETLDETSNFRLHRASSLTWHLTRFDIKSRCCPFALCNWSRGYCLSSLFWGQTLEFVSRAVSKHLSFSVTLTRLTPTHQRTLNGPSHVHKWTTQQELKTLPPILSIFRLKSWGEHN